MSSTTSPFDGRRAWMELGSVLLLATLISLAWLRVPIAELALKICPDPGDPLFNLVVIKWGAAQWAAGLPDFWNAPFFFPIADTITLSDHLLGPSALVALLLPLLPNELAALNLLLIASFALSATTSHWVLRQAGLSFAAAATGALVFAFSPYRLSQLHHPQILYVQWIPLLLWLWDRLLAERTARRALAFGLVYLLHVTGGNYLAYMIHVPLAVIFAVRLKSEGKALLEARSPRVLGSVALFCGALLAALFVPYLTAESGLATARPASSWRFFGAAFGSFITPAPLGLHAGAWAEKLARPENALFAGVVASLLVVAGWVALARHSKGRAAAPLSSRQRLTLGLLLAAAGFALLAAEAYTFQGTRRISLFGLALKTHEYRNPLYLLIVALGAWAYLKYRWQGTWPSLGLPRDPWTRGLVLGTLAAVLLCFPLFYAPFADRVPGFDHMRVPARFYAIASFGLAFLAARGLDALSGRWRWAAAVVPLAVLAETWPRAVPWVELEREAQAPAAYAWLRAQPEVIAVAEYPLGDPTMDLAAMYRQSWHGKALVNGYSGHFPGHYELLRPHCCALTPPDEDLALLRRLGTTHLVVRSPGLGFRKEEELKTFGKKPGVKRVFKDERSSPPITIFRLEPP